VLMSAHVQDANPDEDMLIFDVYTSNHSNTRSMVPGPCACTSVRKAARVLARTFDSGLAGSGLNIRNWRAARRAAPSP